MNDNKSTGNQEVIQRLKSAEALYVLISGCTKEPYIVCDVGPVIGTHTGPGCVGFAYVKAEEWK